jgi:hypothetical protein
MKMPKLIKAAGLVFILAVAGTNAFAQPPGYYRGVQPGDRYAYVWVTGSRIPQRVKISPVGTLTFNALSVWDRRQINQTGRTTTEGVLVQDPSVHVIMGRPSGM